MTDPPLRGKVALITGASRKIGLGAAIAREFARAGANVFISYYRPYDAEMPWGSQPAEADELIAELRDNSVQAAGAEINLSDPAVPRTLFDLAIEVFGQVTILVNNATYSVDVSVDHLTADLIDKHYAVNVRGMMMLCAEFTRRFSGRSGCIINLTSGQGIAPMAGNLAYAATKGAVDAFTLSLSAELAPRGITVNAIDPGPTDTGWMDAALKDDLQRRAPLGRIGLPEDAAKLARFLASDDGGWITGQVIHSRGGF
jgi:3-oxoacyl-[acyl-carrier protein] reductase